MCARDKLSGGDVHTLPLQQAEVNPAQPQSLFKVSMEPSSSEMGPPEAVMALAHLFLLLPRHSHTEVIREAGSLWM